MWALPCLTDTDEARLSGIPLDNALAIIEQRREGYDFFQGITDSTVKHTKTVGTTGQRMSAMLYPVLMQRFATWMAREDKVWDIYDDGMPVLVDLLQIGSWPRIRAGL